MLRAIYLSILAFGMIISVASAAMAAEMKYKSAALRDPFVDSTDEKPIDDSARIEASMRAMTVQGVIVSGDSKSAIINGTIYRVGAKLGLGEIKDIDQDNVIISYNGKEIKLQLIKRNPSHEKKAGPANSALQK